MKKLLSLESVTPKNLHMAGLSYSFYFFDIIVLSDSKIISNAKLSFDGYSLNKHNNCVVLDSDVELIVSDDEKELSSSKENASWLAPQNVMFFTVFLCLFMLFLCWFSV